MPEIFASENDGSRLRFDWTRELHPFDGEDFFGMDPHYSWMEYQSKRENDIEDPEFLAVGLAIICVFLGLVSGLVIGFVRSRRLKRA